MTPRHATWLSLASFQFVARTLASARSQFAVFTLIAILQKAPLVFRSLATIKHSAEPATRMLQRAAAFTAGLGGYHAVSGATTAVYVTDPEHPLAGEVGQPLQMGFGVQNTLENASSWFVSGNIPPGMDVTGLNQEPRNEEGVFNARFGVLSGTPTEPGIYTIFLQPFRDLNAMGPTAEALEVTITIEGTAELVQVRVKVTRASGGSIVASWQAVPGQSYKVESSSSEGLETQDWETLDVPIKSQGDQQSVTLETGLIADPLFIRVNTSFE